MTLTRAERGVRLGNVSRNTNRAFLLPTLSLCFLPTLRCNCHDLFEFSLCGVYFLHAPTSPPKLKWQQRDDLHQAPYVHFGPMLPVPDDDCNACGPDWVIKRRPSAVAISAFPFVLTFLVVVVAVSNKLFPLLSGQAQLKGHHDGQLQGFAWREKTYILKKLRITARGLASATFSTNIALSTVLVELILCEISNTVNPAARTIALKLTLPSLLFLLIIVTPALIIHSVVSNAGWDLGGSQRGQRRIAWALEISGLGLWLAGFWYLGRGLLGTYLHEKSYIHEHTFSEGCLERIGVIGISLMASLAGFAAVSSLWQTFGVKYRLVCAVFGKHDKKGFKNAY